jgi:Flp pilus assembly protein CpaB
MGENMKLYQSMNLASGKWGTVYHLRQDCPQTEGPDTDVMEVTPSTVKAQAKALGMGRICLPCRKAAEKKRPVPSGSFRLRGNRILFKG